MPQTRIVIAGGGFSGAATALFLARSAPGPLAIDIAEPRPRLGEGVAYATRNPAHRINVPAAKMTLFAEEPGHFDAWLQARPEILAADPQAGLPSGGAFPQRSVFGRYVAELLAQALASRPDIAFRHWQAKATDAAPHAGGYALRLDSGATLQADRLVLAMTHPPPAIPPELRPVLESGAPVVTDPWSDSALGRLPPEAAVLILGTGLTMADVVAALDARGHRGAVLAISRHGLLSRGHDPSGGAAWPHFGAAEAPGTALAMTREIRRQIRLAEAAGQPWHSVLDDVRAHATRLWCALPEAEQRRLVRHVRSYWDVHRFRVAPQPEASIARMRQSGVLRVLAARLVGAEWPGAGPVSVTYRRRGEAAAEIFRADAVILATGPAHGSVFTVNPLLSALAGAGRLQRDPAGLGVLVDERSRAIGESGPDPALFVAGPLARGRFGELMGLPQVSWHAKLVAEQILAA